MKATEDSGAGQAADHDQVPVVPREELASWRDEPPFAFKLALFLNRYAPRGQGWFPRIIGKHLCHGAKFIVRTQHGAVLAVDPGSLDYYTMMLKGGGHQ